MPRKRYQFTDADVTTVHRWIRDKFRTQPNSFPKDRWGNLSAYDAFPFDKPTAKKLQVWCERWLEAAQWRQLQAVIRSARRDRYSTTKSVKLTKFAHAILSMLAKREGITLSEVIETYLGPRSDDDVSPTSANDSDIIVQPSPEDQQAPPMAPLRPRLTMKNIFMKRLDADMYAVYGCNQKETF